MELVISLLYPYWIRFAMMSFRVASVGVEWLFSAVSRKPYFESRDTATNFRMYGGYLIINSLWLVAVVFIYKFAASRSFFDIGSGWYQNPAVMSWPMWLFVFAADDFTFYWYHRAQHRIRLLWGSHAGHHSSQEFNYSVGLRQPWAQPFALLFWLPLIVIGVDPFLLACVTGVNFTFQHLLHTRHVGKLGALEWIFNTPSHHRVHHGSNPQYIDKNFGGILIIWDRLFGTFAPESEPVVYGLGGTAKYYSAWENSFADYLAAFRDFARQSTPDAAWNALFGPPDSTQR